MKFCNLAVSKIETAHPLSIAQAKGYFTLVHIRLFLSAKADRALQGTQYRKVLREAFLPSIPLVMVLSAFAVYV